MILERFDRDHFLRNHWQRHPLLIRHDGSRFQDPLDPDELAGLACEESIESRLVLCDGENDWQVRHGPFDDSDFEHLGRRHWTLLVQAVDQELAPVETLKRQFDFLPAWRLDDVMVSFATDGGGVGPHYDNYDVFLVQGLGSRLWRLGAHCDSSTPMRQDAGLRLLESFEPEVEYRLNPGDILYLPPGVSHQGISEGDSLCYSIGFRAPSYSEALQAHAEALAATIGEERRYRDPAPTASQTSGSIDSGDILGFFKELTPFIDNISAFSDGFGRLVTEPRYPERVLPQMSDFSAQELISLINKRSQDIVISTNPSSRFAWLTDPDGIRLFVDGERFDCRPDQVSILEHLCTTPWTQPLDRKLLAGAPEMAGLLAELVNRGSLLLETTAT